MSATIHVFDSPLTPQLEKTVEMCDGEFCNHNLSLSSVCPQAEFHDFIRHFSYGRQRICVADSFANYWSFCQGHAIGDA